MSGNEFKEAFAAIILIEAGIITQPFNSNWLKDRPDLQLGDLGIEVTEAISTDEGEQRFFQQEMLDCNNIEEVNKLPITKTPKNRNKAKQLGETPLHYVSTSLEIFDEDKTSNLIVSRILSKNEKFPEYPNQEIFSKRWLFIFAEDIFVSISPLDFNRIKSEANNSIFDRVFIMLNYDLIETGKGVTEEIKKSFEAEKFLELSVEASKIINAPDVEKKEDALRKYKVMKNNE